MVLGAGALGWWGHEGGALVTGISAAAKHQCEDTAERQVIYELGSGLLPDTEAAWHLDLELPSLQSYWETNVCLSQLHCFCISSLSQLSHATNSFQRGHFILRYWIKAQCWKHVEPPFLTYWLKLGKSNDVSEPQSTQLQVDTNTGPQGRSKLNLIKYIKTLTLSLIQRSAQSIRAIISQEHLVTSRYLICVLIAIEFS